MKEISILHTFHSDMKNAEHKSFNKQVVEFLRNHIEYVPDSTLVWKDYFQLYLLEDIAFRQSLWVAKNEEIAKLIKIRDDAYVDFKRIVHFNLDCRDKVISAAAHKLDFIITKYEKILEVSYNKNKRQMNSMLQDMEVAEFKEALDILGLTYLIAKIDQYNLLFDASYANYAGRQDIEAHKVIIDMRRQVDRAFFRLVGYINMAFRENEEGKQDIEIRWRLGKIIDWINSLIKKAIYV